MTGNKGTATSVAREPKEARTGNSSDRSENPEPEVMEHLILADVLLGTKVVYRSPVYNVQEEGRVVVSITVNPAGHVIATSINRLTNTVNSTLRKAAEDAAKKARFNAVDGVNNQTGTITYYFNLR